MLAPARPWRSRLALPSRQAAEPSRPDHAAGYRPWAELLARTFAVDVLACPSCQGLMKLLAIVKDPAGIARCLVAESDPTEAPRRSPKVRSAPVEEPRAPPAGADRAGAE